MKYVEKPQIKQIKFTHNKEFEPFRDRWSDLISRLDDLEGAPSSVENGRIYVDLMPHGNFNYFFSNLLIGKYLSILSGKPMIGIMCEPQLFVRFCYTNDEIKKLAEIFNLREIIHIDSFETRGGSEDQSGQMEPSTDDLKSLVAAKEMEFAGCRYFGFEDRIRRRYKLGRMNAGTIKNSEFSRQAQFSQKVLNLAESQNFSAKDDIVTGHIEYDPYRLTCIKMLEAGGRILYNWVLQPVSIKVFDSLDTFIENRSFSQRINFEWLYNKTRDAGCDFDKMRAVYLQSLKQVRPTEVRTSLGDQEGMTSTRPQSLIMLQALSDAVHSYGNMLFDDFTGAIETTIEILLKSGYDVTLRQHPMQALYDQTGFFEELNDRYKDESRLHCVTGEDEIHLSSYDHCVTTHGTPGIEAPMDMVETTVNGRARYSGCGFVNEPKSVAEYESFLGSKQQRLTQEELVDRRHRASLYAYTEIFSERTVSVFLPRGLRSSPPASMDYLERCASEDLIYMDPLFRRLAAIHYGREDWESELKKTPLIGKCFS